MAIKDPPTPMSTAMGEKAGTEGGTDIESQKDQSVKMGTTTIANPMARTKTENLSKVTLSILRLISLIFGFFFLYESSFSVEQLKDASKEEMVLMFFALFLAFFLAFVIMPWICADPSQCVCPSHFLLRSAVNIFALTLASLVVFLCKYPRFDCQSAVWKFSTEEGGTRRRQIFNMCSVGMFAFLALLLSRKSQDALEFGIFNLFLELTIEASMEIPGENHRPNLWYLLGASVYCAVLVVIRSYVGPPSREADVEEGGASTKSTVDEDGLGSGSEGREVESSGRL